LAHPFSVGSDPPPINELAAPGPSTPNAAADIERPWQKSIRAKDTASSAAKQACRAMLRQDIGAALHLATGTAALALECIEAGDDFAVRYLTQRVHLYSRFAAETALELRRAAT
jgi:hypothetical protein